MTNLEKMAIIRDALLDAEAALDFSKKALQQYGLSTPNSTVSKGLKAVQEALPLTLGGIPIKTKFLNKNGYDAEREAAAKIFKEGKEYEIIGGDLHGSFSTYIFKGIQGSWNTVMFDVSWEQAVHLLEDHTKGYL